MRRSRPLPCKKCRSAKLPPWQAKICSTSTALFATVPKAKATGPAAGGAQSSPAGFDANLLKNGGKFPELQVQHSIKGEADVPAAHGSKDMPVWGNLFRHLSPNQDLGAIRVYNLVKYIEQIQAK